MCVFQWCPHIAVLISAKSGDTYKHTQILLFETENFDLKGKDFFFFFTF